MPANPKLPLNECPWVTVFRLIDVTLRSDPDLQRVVRTWQSWEGDTGSAQEIAIAAAPAIQLTPVMGEESYWAADSMQGDLVIQVYMVIPGYCSDDVGNLWFAIEKALYPNTPQTNAAYIYRLQQAGAHKGLIIFSRPATFAADQAGQDGCLRAQGSMKISVRLNINT